MSNAQWATANRLISAYRKTCEYFGVEATWDGFMELMDRLKVDTGLAD